MSRVKTGTTVKGRALARAWAEAEERARTGRGFADHAEYVRAKRAANYEDFARKHREYMREYMRAYCVKNRERINERRRLRSRTQGAS